MIASMLGIAFLFAVVIGVITLIMYIAGKQNLREQESLKDSKRGLNYEAGQKEKMRVLVDSAQLEKSYHEDSQMQLRRLLAEAARKEKQAQQQQDRP